MRKKTTEASSKIQHQSNKPFRFEFLNPSQKIAWGLFQQHDVLFLIGPAGTGKTILSTAFAINEILSGNKKKIIITRPIVESGESLGYLPGDFHEKVNPYMMPIYDCINQLVSGTQKEQIMSSIEVIPLAYMRGRNFRDAICIFDEAQNANKLQLKLFLTRFNKNCKLIINGDPKQTDVNDMGLMTVINRLQGINGLGIIEFKANSIVRHPMINEILERLED